MGQSCSRGFKEIRFHRGGKLAQRVGLNSTSYEDSSLHWLLELNAATRKDHFLLSFIDQMLERLAGNEYYCFLEGYSGYN